MKIKLILALFCLSIFFGVSVAENKPFAKGKNVQKERVIQSGDRLFLMCNLPGDRVNKVYRVRRGFIEIKGIGKVKLAGMSIKKAQSLIWRKMTNQETKLYVGSEISLMLGYYIPYKGM